MESVCMAAEEEKPLCHDAGLIGTIRVLERRLIQESLNIAAWNRGQASNLLKNFPVSDGAK
jgi:hypothetical protein